MAREIKFRGKVKYPEKGYTLFRNLKEGEWAYGDLHLNAPVPHIHTSHLETYPIDPETVGQYIGVNDKNGEEIYEGDFVRYHMHDRFADEAEYQTGRVEFEGGRFCAKLDKSWLYFGGDFEDYEVIGNVWDNPEL